MFGMKKSAPTRGDLLIKELSDLLFPPFRTMESEGEKFAVDSSVDTNLDAVLTDLREGYLDEVCINSLQTIFEKLYKARELLNAFHQMDADVSKYIITMQPTTNQVDQIEAADDESL